MRRLVLLAATLFVGATAASASSAPRLTSYITFRTPSKNIYCASCSPTFGTSTSYAATSAAICDRSREGPACKASTESRLG